VEAEREPAKKKSKKTLVQEPTLKEAVASLTLPVGQSTVTGIRNRIAPFVGEALLGQVYALSACPALESVPFNSDLVRKHDFGTPPWSATQVDASGRISGNLVRLSQALARLAAASSVYGAQRSAFVEETLNSFQLIRRRWVTRDGEEFVARTIDLGEEVLALYYKQNPSTVGAFKQLDHFMTQRRALAVKTLVERGEIATAMRVMTLSELYALGKFYLDQRVATTPLVNLSAEPGALGALARVISRSQPEAVNEISPRLRREIDQFGMSTMSLTGLSRLELIEPEPYEYAVGFKDDFRLAERVQDLKLALARRSHRLGGGAMFPLNPILAQRILQNTLAEARKAASGTSPPERDWWSLMMAIQALDEHDFALVVDQIANSSYTRSVVRIKWNDPRPPNAALGLKPER
jgi:hypothetical protein